MASKLRICAGLLMLLAACGGVSRPVFERFDARVTPSANDHPDVPAIVLLDRALLTFGVEQERRVPYARLRRYRRVKVLRSTGLPLGRIVVPHDPGTILRGMIARAVQPDGTVTEADEGREVDHETGVRARVVDVPDVRVGTIVEYAYDIYADDLRFVPPWVFQGRLPTLRSEYAVVVPDGFEVDLRFSQNGRFIDRPPERFEIDGATRYSWSMADLPPLFVEPDMPKVELLAPRAHVLFQRARVGGQVHEGFESWDSVAIWHLGRLERWANLSDATVREARRVAGDSPQDERALKLMEVLARDLAKPAGPPPPLWRAPMVHPDQVLRDRAANPTTRGMLLVALLRSVGVRAVPALYAYGDRDVLAPDAATVRALDGVAAVVPRTGGALVLDPNQMTVSSDVPGPRLQQTQLVLMRPDGAEIVRVPRSSPQASRCEIDFELRLDPGGDIFGQVNARLTGAEAGALREQLLPAPPDAYAARVSEFLHKRGIALPIESVSIADLRALRRPLSLKGRLNGPRTVPNESTELFVRLGDIIGWPTAATRKTRRTPLLLGAPRELAVRGTLALPEGYEPSIMPPSFGHGFQGVAVRFEARAETRGRIGFVRTERWPITEVSPRRYPAYYRFVESVRSGEDQAFSIRRPPERPLEY